MKGVRARVSMRSCKGKVSACLPPCCQDSSTKLHLALSLNTGLSKNSSKTREGLVTCPLLVIMWPLSIHLIPKSKAVNVRSFSEDMTVGARIYLVGHKKQTSLSQQHESANK